MEAAPSSGSSASSEGCAVGNAAETKCNQEERMENWRSRLRAFYWAHDPRKVDRVDEILARHKGNEELFLQRVHWEFGVRDFSGEEAIDDIYEHQRYSYLSFSWGSSYPGHLLPTDRRQWSGQHGSPSSQNRQKVEPQLPVNWCWASDWTVDKTSCKCDTDGWIYALDFTMINYSIKKGQERSEPNATDYVRRRRWVRMRRRVHAALSTIAPPAIGSLDNSVSLCSGDESTKDITWVVENGEGCEKIAPKVKITDTSEGGGKQVSGDHGEHDATSDHERPDSLRSPKTEPVPITRIELEHFPLDIDKSGFNAAWKEAVKDLEHVYTFAKDNRAERKKKWLIKKEKIKRQIHLLEKTIVSMQAVAKEEEESRQSERLKYQSSPHHSMRSILSPTSSSVPGNVSMDSPTNAINLASRMQCAQSKLDALRRFYWHPRENNYTLRFSIDGIFYGLRDFLVESFNSSFSIQISHQTNGAQGITPTCKVMMKGHTVCCGKHVKVVGEKGTRIPKSIWDSMYMDSDFEASICLIYVEDVADPGSMAQGSWEFLLSPEATRVELINFSRRVKGGMDLPEPMVRKLCSDVLTSLIRDLTLLYFPYELAVAFKLPPAKLDIKGELQITGQPIDDVMEKELQEIELGSIQEVKNKLRNPATASEKDSNELKTPLGPIMGAAANAAHKFSSLLSGSDKNMQAIANLLEISPAQFNLLVALKNCKLFPLTHNFHSLASICAYYNAFSIDEECIESKDPERAGHEEKLRATWKRILELIYIQRQQATGAKSTPSATPRTTHAESEEARTTPHVELFDVDKFFDAIRRLSKKPASVQVSVQHFYCTLNALNVVEALSKLYERVALGIDYRKPRSGTDEFIYGIRLGRKVLQQPAMAMAAAAVAASAAAVSAEDDVVYPVGSPPVLDLRRYRPAEVAFRTRVQTFSKFWQTLIKVVEFVRENVDDVSIELAGNLKGSGGDCVLNGSFKDAEFRGPLSMGIAVPPCFLGFYRAEMIPLGNDRVGMQVDVMLPSTPKAVGDDAMQQSTKALGSIGRVMIADLTSEVVIDLDALIAHEQRRRDGAKSGSATHEPPTQGRPQSIAMGSPKQHGAALLSPTSSRSPKQNSSSLSSAGSAKQNTAGVAAGVPKKSYQHRALTFSFGPTSRGAESDHVTTSGTYGQLNVSTSEFTKLHTTAKAGSFMFHLLSIVDWVFTTYVRPQMLRAFPEHQMLLDAAQVTLRQILRSTKLEMNFDVMARAFIHEDESLMVTLCGSPLHPMPIMYKDKVNLLDIIMQVDALANIWIDDRYPPYSNPLYF